MFVGGGGLICIEARGAEVEGRVELLEASLAVVFFVLLRVLFSAGVMEIDEGVCFGTGFYFVSFVVL